MTASATTRRRAVAALAAGAASLGAAPAWAQRGPRDVVKARPAMGINLAGVNYWDTELPFVDLMRTSGDWQLWRAEGNVPLKGVVPEVDARGWLRGLREGQVAMLPLAAISHLPDTRRGPYVVRYEGEGDIDLEGVLRVVRREPGRLECEYVPRSPLPDPSLWLRINRTDTANPLRNIRVLKPGTEAQAAGGNPWDSAFIARWSGWGALRAMDMMSTNNSKQARWSDRPLPEDRTWTPKGMPLELFVDLANRCGAGPWLCMPHRADDDYVRRAATLVHQRLDERLGAWVEHSNEVWNPDFEQSAHAAQQGLAQGLAPDANLARWRWHAKRSRDIFAIWSQPFAGSKRLRRVLSTQSGNAWGTQQLLADPVVETADVLGVAAYLPLTPRGDSTPSSAEVARWSLERVFEHFEQMLDVLRQQLTEQRRWCARHGLLLAAYEGGQHAVGVGEVATRDDALTRLFTAANRDERMGLMYRRLFDAWEQADGDLFCHFSSVSAPSRWGHWGLLEHHDDDPATRPKYRVTRERMQRWRSRP